MMEGKYVLDILRSGFIDEIPLIIVGFDEKGRMIYWNRHAEEVLGFSVVEAVELGLQTVIPVLCDINSPTHDIPTATCALRSIFSGEKTFKEKETSILSQDGGIRYIRWTGYMAECTINRGEKAFILSGVDKTDVYALREVVSERSRYIRSAAQRLKKYTKIDALTGLFNYRHLISELTREYYRAVEDDSTVALSILNLDYFNSVNAAYGTINGDRILRELASLVKKIVGPEIITARFSGNEIAFLMPGMDIKSSFKISRKVLAEVSEHKFSATASGPFVNLSAHMALGGYPHCEDARTPEQLVGRVLFKLKEAGTSASSSVLICSPDASVEAGTFLPEDMMRGEYPYTVEFVNALARAVKTKDHYTQEHSTVMSEYAVLIAERLGLNNSYVRDVRLGSILHDVGKIGIDKDILLKPGVLNEEEREIIKQHPRIGAEIIRHVHPLKGVVPIVLHHHERFDGNGYLEGLNGETIPIGARIVSLADVFQALTSDRPYRKALPDADAISIIKEYSGSYFDPKVVSAFFDVYASRK